MSYAPYFFPSGVMLSLGRFHRVKLKIDAFATIYVQYVFDSSENCGSVVHSFQDALFSNNEVG